MLALILAVPTVVTAIITFRLYRWAGARFDLKSIDPLTYIYFLQLIMASLGSYIIGANLVANDWVNYLSPMDPVRVIGWGIVQYGFFAGALGLLIGLKLFNRNEPVASLLRNTSFRDNRRSYHLMVWVILFTICVGAGLHVYTALGGFPLLSALSSNGDTLAAVRSKTKLGFSGITFIRDFGFIATSQIIAYYSYSLKLGNPNSRVFGTLFWLSLVLAILGLTINLEKGPLVIFFFSLMVIRFFHGRRSSMWAQTLSFLLLACLLVVTYLLTLGFDRTVWFFVDEIMGRILIAQVAGVFMTLSVFPEQYDFVLFSGIGVFSDAFGGPQSEGSPRIVMQHFRPIEVAAGLLGYKSSFYVAEAYGNFGAVGVLISPFIVGGVTAFYFIFFRRFQNKHLGVAGVTFIAFNLPYTSNFSAFYYNPGLWILLLILLLIGNPRLKSSLKVESDPQTARRLRSRDMGI
jgi:hypothetical protein